MKHIPLGQTGISVSEICLGTMTWGSQNTEAEGHAQMDLALARGVNFWDTPFKGMLDEVTIYSEAISAEDVLQLYQQSVSP